jgi:EAL domain-containing protein (putative c-di-GMP-specific phosphodiesterase class I)/pSer/pThr/pTyr-binding forkhead associated (FHA) protein
MRTDIIPQHALGLPWLEHFSADGGPPEKTVLEKSPFLIGRGETTDLQVVSHGVSREHAAIVREGRTTRIRDLGSTNGTFVNGRRIKEANLSDGDMVRVADVEFTFCCGEPQTRHDAITQVLASDTSDEFGDSTQDLRRAVRSLHETLVSGCVLGRLKPIFALRKSELAGFQTAEDDVSPASIAYDPNLPPIPGRVIVRLRHLRRARAIEQAAARKGDFFILVNVQPVEVASGRLLELASIYCELLPEPRRLVVAVPCVAAEEVANILSPGGRLRELGASVALSEFGGRDVGKAVVTEIRPDFVKIAASMVAGTSGNSMTLRNNQAMLRAIVKNGTKLIATGVNSPAERAGCLEAGCEFGQGGLFDERESDNIASRGAKFDFSHASLDSTYLSPT